MMTTPKTPSEFDAFRERAARLTPEAVGNGVLDKFLRELTSTSLTFSEQELILKAVVSSTGVTQKSIVQDVNIIRGGVGASTDGMQGRPLQFVAPKLWPDPVSGADLLDEIVGTLKRFIILPQGAAETTALWVFFSHSYQCFQIAPILLITSPEPRCGKTQLLRLLYALVPKPTKTTNMTAVTMFRVIEMHAPTLLIDEGDTFLDGDDMLRGMLNAGHTPDDLVWRTVGENHEPRGFGVWCPKVLARINLPWNTVLDRSVHIRMNRRRPDEKVERLMKSNLNALAAVQQKLARWCADHVDALKQCEDPLMPAMKSDRACDNWRILVAIADIVGGVWPEKARSLARSMEQEETAASSDGLKMLEDLRNMFEPDGSPILERIETAMIEKTLWVMNDRPWNAFRGGGPITPHAIADLLEPFGIKPTKWKAENKKTPRGYLWSSCQDAFARYLPAKANLKAPHPPPLRNDSSFHESQSATKKKKVALQKAKNTNKNNEVAVVADSTPKVKVSA